MMATIWELTNDALETITPAVPFAASAYIPATPGVFPDLYLVYIVVDMLPAQHANDEETLRSELVQISIYNRAGLNSLPDVIGAMTAAGFTFVAGREIAYDLETRHYGLAFDFEYLENLDEA
jgi:hypothetical protein